MELKTKELAYLIVLAVLIASLGICSNQKGKVSQEGAAANEENFSIRVHVTGEVLAPDVYTLPLGSIVQDAVQAAGGPTPAGDIHRLNLAAYLVDGQKIHLPAKLTDQQDAAGPTLININTADAKTLESLPGIGPARAQKIIDYRRENGPFSSIEEITEVSTIGPQIFADIKDLITF